MFCNMCGKNKVTVHFSQAVNGHVTELHLCESCAKKKGIDIQDPFSVSDLLAGITDKHGFVHAAKKWQCSMCGLTYNQFRKVGRLGCAQCYDSFREPLTNLLKRIHGSQVHVGKGPGVAMKKKGGRDSVQGLKEELFQAIKNEEYEKAAKLRDMIRSKKNEDKNDCQ